LTGDVLLGAVPGVYLGARLSSRAPDRVLRPLLVVALTSSALKLLGASNRALPVAAIAVGMLAVALSLIEGRSVRRPRFPPFTGPSHRAIIAETEQPPIPPR
jgi:hypothetical protein